jgi:hypothetical protein
MSGVYSVSFGYRKVPGENPRGYSHVVKCFL